MSSTFKFIVFLLVAATVAAIAAVATGVIQLPGAPPRSTPSKDGKDGTKQRTAPREELLIELNADETTGPAIVEELEGALGRRLDDTSAATPLSDLKSKDGIDPFRLLDGDRGRLAEWVPAGKLKREDAIALRDYLAEWRRQLKSLRETARKTIPAELPSDALAGYPVLSLLRELKEGPGYGALDQAAAPGVPRLPWFTANDVETARILAALFERSDAGKAFQAAVLEFERPRFTAEVLRAMHSPTRAEAIRDECEIEAGKVQRKNVLSESDLDQLSRVWRQFSQKFLVDRKLPAALTAALK